MTVPIDTAHSLAGLSGQVLAAPDSAAALTLVAEVSTAVLPACDGSSVTLRQGGLPSASAASDDWSAALDRAQVEEQEGPCLDCMREGSLQRVPDLGSDPRFPSYGQRAAAMGARSALSVPLLSDGHTVGALNLYSRRPDAFDTPDVAVASLLGAHASLALQAAVAFFSSRELAGQLQEAMVSRAEIEQAKGILMAQRGCSADEAFRLLVELSQHTNRKLRDVAAALVEQTTTSGS